MSAGWMKVTESVILRQYCKNANQISFPGKSQYFQNTSSLKNCVKSWVFEPQPRDDKFNEEIISRKKENWLVCRWGFWHLSLSFFWGFLTIYNCSLGCVWNGVLHFVFINTPELASAENRNPERILKHQNTLTKRKDNPSYTLACVWHW